MADAAGGLEEAKDLAESFVRTFGVVDIVLGGLGLYGLRLAAPWIAEPFVTTGQDFADNALLVCAAALAGKIVNLMASAVLAFLPVMPTYKKRLEEAVSVKGEGPLAEHDLYARALAYLEDHPAVRRYEQIRDNAVLSYGAAMVLFGMSALWTGRTVVRVAMFGVAVVLFFVGWLYHNDATSCLEHGLVASARSESSPRIDSTD